MLDPRATPYGTSITLLLFSLGSATWTQNISCFRQSDKLILLTLHSKSVFNRGITNKKIKTEGLDIILINSVLRKKQKKQKGFTTEKNQKAGIVIKSMLFS